MYYFLQGHISASPGAEPSAGRWWWWWCAQVQSARAKRSSAGGGGGAGGGGEEESEGGERDELQWESGVPPKEDRARYFYKKTTSQLVQPVGNTTSTTTPSTTPSTTLPLQVFSVDGCAILRCTL